ncbi:hypothetical protein RND71_010906 [Anisodus tanguticus]|uniref:Uncharacterized protein n=1 Tax=Anisodus tanguticus TaxID=243964 RepID=A0AAE1SKQ0_9SOLA|nr:hypothetical protein RND71_010906 [Anisodus tanguticus]
MDLPPIDQISNISNDYNEAPYIDDLKIEMLAKSKMGEDLLTTLTIESNHLSTLLSMDSGSSSHDELERELIRTANHLQPPDINLPLELSPPPPS